MELEMKAELKKVKEQVDLRIKLNNFDIELIQDHNKILQGFLDYPENAQLRTIDIIKPLTERSVVRGKI